MLPGDFTVSEGHGHPLVLIDDEFVNHGHSIECALKILCNIWIFFEFNLSFQQKYHPLNEIWEVMWKNVISFPKF
jgi:hypothetical protein